MEENRLTIQMTWQVMPRKFSISIVFSNQGGWNELMPVLSLSFYFDASFFFFYSKKKLLLEKFSYFLNGGFMLMLVIILLFGFNFLNSDSSSYKSLTNNAMCGFLSDLFINIFLLLFDTFFLFIRWNFMESFEFIFVLFVVCKGLLVNILNILKISKKKSSLIEIVFKCLWILQAT